MPEWQPDGSSRGTPPVTSPSGSTSSMNILSSAGVRSTAAPLNGGPSRRIDLARIYIPAAEPGEVWTVIPGPLGQGQMQIQRVAMDGTVVVSTDALDLSRYQPLYGVPVG